jgi:hypothetical protein
VGEVVDRVRRKRLGEGPAALKAVIGGVPAHDRPGQEAVQYFALCERAWLHWSRLALDAIMVQTLGQVSFGVFNPARVRTGDDAAKAAVRCGLHGRLLDVASGNVTHSDWPWRLEAARQVHASTQKALRFAAAMSTTEARSVSEMDVGISSAVDAVVTAIAAGFVVDGPTEVRETVEAMVRGAEIDRRPEETTGDKVSAGQ